MMKLIILEAQNPEDPGVRPVQQPETEVPSHQLKVRMFACT